jgi:hypothetical protein
MSQQSFERLWVLAGVAIFSLIFGKAILRAIAGLPLFMEFAR